MFSKQLVNWSRTNSQSLSRVLTLHCKALWHFKPLPRLIIWSRHESHHSFSKTQHWTSHDALWYESTSWPVLTACKPHPTPSQHPHKEELESPELNWMIVICRTIKDMYGQANGYSNNMSTFWNKTAIKKSMTERTNSKSATYVLK